MPTLRVRPATPDDVPLILALIRELAEYEREPDAAKATPGQILKHVLGVGANPHERVAECVIGEVENEPQGFAVFFHTFSTWTGSPGMHLEDLYVRPCARKCGLGRALLARVAAIAVERGCPRFEWAVLDWNTPAIGFYESLGAKAMGEWTTYRTTGEALRRLAALDLEQG